MSVLRLSRANLLATAGLVMMLLGADYSPHTVGAGHTEAVAGPVLTSAQAVAQGAVAFVTPQIAAAPEPASGTGTAPTPPPPPPVAASRPGVAGPVPPAAAVSTQQALINADRAAAGLPGLAWSGCLAGVAAQNAQRMAAAGGISHADGPSRDLGCGLGSSRAGENVGFWTGGIDDGRLNQMFMASAGHRDNIMGPFRYVGTAWATAANGSAYIAVEFA